MTWFSILQRWLVGVLNVLVVLSIVGLAGTMTLQVFLRYVVQSSFLGVEEISTLFGLWLYFTGLALVTARDRHIRGGFIGQTLSPRSKRWVDVGFALLGAAICAYFFVLSLEYVAFIFEANRRSTFLRWPSFLWAASLSLGLGLSALLSVIRAVRPTEERG